MAACSNVLAALPSDADVDDPNTVEAVVQILRASAACGSEEKFLVLCTVPSGTVALPRAGYTSAPLSSEPIESAIRCAMISDSA